MLFFILAGSALADTENTLGLKNGKALFDAKKKALPEIRIANAIDGIGLDVHISSSPNHDQALNISQISASDRVDSFFNNKKPVSKLLAQRLASCTKPSNPVIWKTPSVYKLASILTFKIGRA